MTNAAWRAALIGAAVAAGLQIVGIIPCVGSVISCLGLLALAIAVGMLVVRLSEPPLQTGGKAAGLAAAAGAVTGAASSIVGTVISLVQAALGVGAARGTDFLYRNLPPEALQEMQRYGMDPKTVMSPRNLTLGAAVGGCFSFVFSTLIFAAIAAASAAVYHSMRQGSSSDLAAK
ncbi:MAG: hypothetical protein GX605_02325 [Chloroflexi bacterium]|nr:hypothetical protein [Chloroflexota bacterium]